MSLLFPCFSDREYGRRYEVVRAGMKKAGLDCLVVSGPQTNVRYLSGVAETFGGYVVLPLSGDPTLIVSEVSYVDAEPSRISKYALDEKRRYIDLIASVKDIRGSPMNYVPAIVERVKALGYERGNIGIVDGGSMSFAAYDGVVRSLPNAKITNATSILIEARIIKSAEEIESIKKACRIADQAAEDLLAQTKPGMTESEVFAAYFNSIVKHGAQPGGLFIGFATSTANPTEVFPHNIPYDYTLQKGDVFLCEMGPAYKNGYSCELALTYTLGEPAQPAAYAKVNDVVMDSYNEVLRCLKPGVTADEIREKGDKPLEDAGYVRVAPLLHGYCLGVEGPFVGLPADWVMGPQTLMPGMTVCTQTHAYDPNSLIAVRVEDTYLITDTGSERLTTYTPGLRSVKF